MVGEAPVYCVDTSSLLHAWQRAYPPRRFPALWAAIEALVEQGRLLCSIEVYNELAKKDDEVSEWAKTRKAELCREIDDDVQVALLYVMARYPRLVDTKIGKSGGDPFVIAQALSANPRHVVVTEEQGGSDKSPKIPSVCKVEGIECINLLGLIEREDWSF
jgi:hypothetical protein